MASQSVCSLVGVIVGCSVMPRVKYSAADAMYCAKFIKCMHEMHTPGFSSIQCYDKVPLPAPASTSSPSACHLFLMLRSSPAWTRYYATHMCRQSFLHDCSGIIVKLR